MQSFTAAPSFKNSGLETTLNSSSTLRAASTEVTLADTLFAVPTGTVDLLIIIFEYVMKVVIVSATFSTYLRSAEPSSSGGVPTAMNCI